MRFYQIFIFLIIIQFVLKAQNHSEIDGKLKITQMDLDNSADSIVVRLPDGVLGVREAGTINTFQVISISTDTIFLQNGGYVKLPEDKVNDPDPDPLNEIQQLEVSALGDTLFLSKANYIIIPGISLNQSYPINDLIGGNRIDRAFSVKQTNDRGFIIAGESHSFPSGDISSNINGINDFLVIKLDFKGKVIWDQLLGGNREEIAYDIHEVENGNFIVVGSSTSSNSGDVSGTNAESQDAWVVKLNNTGTIIWEKLFENAYRDVALKVNLASDGSYIIAGESNSESWILKLDHDGNIIWEKLLGDGNINIANSIIETKDSCFVFSSFSLGSMNGDVTGTNNGKSDCWIVKIDQTGNIIWEKLYGGNLNEESYEIIQSSDGGYVFCGFSTSSLSADVSEENHGRRDFWVVKLDSLGNILWDRLLGGTGDDWAKCLIQTTDNNLIIAGITASSNNGDVSGTSNGFWDIWVVNLDEFGNLIWEQNYGGSRNDEVTSIQQTMDGSYIIGGYTTSSQSGDVVDALTLQYSRSHYDDAWIFKIDSSGNILK